MQLSSKNLVYITFLLRIINHIFPIPIGDASVCKLLRDVPIPNIQSREVFKKIYILYLFLIWKLLQVLIRVHAAGVNPVDTYIRSGSYSRRPTLPYIPGLDSAGTIERVGADVTKFKVIIIINANKYLFYYIVCIRQSN